MALVRAGLRLDAFIESPEPGLYPGLGEAVNALPAYYVIKATKVGGRVRVLPKHDGPRGVKPGRLSPGQPS